MTVHSVPTYSLYGEIDGDPGADWLHCETIQARSSLHGYRIEPHRHETLFQILHLRKGQAEFILDGQTHILAGPCIVTLPPLSVHGYVFSPDVEGHVLTLFENRLAEILRSAPEAIGRFRETQVMRLDECDVAGTLTAEIAGLAAEFEGSSIGRLGMIEARLALVLITLHRQLAPLDAANGGESDRALRHIERFRQTVDKDYRSHLPIEAYARRLGLTAPHLNRLCRRHLGASALDIIQHRLVLEAKRYLTFTTLSAKQVALTLAFDDPAYFSRFFRKRTGMTPLQYRMLQQKRQVRPER